VLGFLDEKEAVDAQMLNLVRQLELDLVHSRRVELVANIVRFATNNPAGLVGWRLVCVFVLCVCVKACVSVYVYIYTHV